MDIPPEVLAAKELIEDQLLMAGLITGIDLGMRDEEQPDPDDLALRVFVADLDAIPFEVNAATAVFPFPVVVLQRTFVQTNLPDAGRYQPVLGGVSVTASRFVAAGALVGAGTLGAVVSDAADPFTFYGLRNWHVVCADLGRRHGDEIIQPEPTPLGRVPNDRVGTLERWVYPETVTEGVADAAIFKLERDSLPEVVDVGPALGTVPPRLWMPVSKRGRTTGLTHGFISGFAGKYPMWQNNLPPVGNPPSTLRTFKDQLQICIDFPQSIVFGENGDSGSVVLGDDDRVDGLYWASGYEQDGLLKYGVAAPAATIESELGIRF
jgi:hypothetical protein